MFKEIRLYLKLRPLIAELRKELKMPLKLHAGLQIAASAIAIASVVSGYLPPLYGGILIILINASKDAMAIIAQHYNTNGTSQELPGGRAAETADLIASINKRSPQAK